MQQASSLVAASLSRNLSSESFSNPEESSLAPDHISLTLNLYIELEKNSSISRTCYGKSIISPIKRGSIWRIHLALSGLGDRRILCSWTFERGWYVEKRCRQFTGEVLGVLVIDSTPAPKRSQWDRSYLGIANIAKLVLRELMIS